jgi:drug/metabolite transporter (DMT)-like permease
VSSIPYFGEICALAAPICWSFAVILFRKAGETVPPLALNLFKNLFTVPLYLGTLYLLGGSVFSGAPRSDYLLLILSGALGIGISDTLLFMTLNRVGAGLQAIIATSYSPSIILLSFLFLGERMSLVQLVGVAIIVSAVLTVVQVRGSREGLTRRTLLTGIALGVLATSTQAISIVAIKPLLEESSILWANCWRMLGGVVTCFLLLPLVSGRRRALRTLGNVRVWPVMIPGTILGTYVSLIFWLAGMKYTYASVAAALNQTATLFTFLLAVLILKEPVTRIRLAALLLGLVGVALVIFW